MKTNLLLVRGLLASVLFTIGFVSIAERFDPVMDAKSAATSNDAVLRTCDAPCVVIVDNPAQIKIS